MSQDVKLVGLSAVVTVEPLSVVPFADISIVVGPGVVSVLGVAVRVSFPSGV